MLLYPWDFPCKNTVVGCYFLLQGIFLTQGSNLGLPYCRQTLPWATREANHEVGSEKKKKGGERRRPIVLKWREVEKVHNGKETKGQLWKCWFGDAQITQVFVCYINSIAVLIKMKVGKIKYGLPLRLRWWRICLQCGRRRFNLWIGMISLEKGMATHSSILAWRIT